MRRRSREQYPSSDESEDAYGEGEGARLLSVPSPQVQVRRRGQGQGLGHLAPSGQPFTPRHTYARGTEGNGAASEPPPRSADSGGSGEAAGAPLPALPENYSWRRNEDGTHQLERGAGAGAEAVLIEHLVTPSDTLRGLCLRYRVCAQHVRRLNYLSADAVQHLRVLRVPLRPDTPVSMQPRAPELATRDFCARTGEGSAEAGHYLRDCGFDLEKALGLWREDEAWATRAEGVPSAHRASVERRASDASASLRTMLPRDSLRRRVRGV